MGAPTDVQVYSDDYEYDGDDGFAADYDYPAVEPKRAKYEPIEAAPTGSFSGIVILTLQQMIFGLLTDEEIEQQSDIRMTDVYPKQDDFEDPPPG